VKILIPDTIELELDLPPGVDAAGYVVTQPIPAAHADAEVLVVWGNALSMLEDAAARLPRLRWVQTLAAGADPLLRAGFAADTVLTSGQTLHDRPVAEHALALVLAAARRLHLTHQAQLEHRWAPDLGGMQPEHDPDVFTTLRGARVLIWGYGGIARTVTPLLQALGATVTGVARTARTDGEVRVIPVEEIETELPTTDVLLMILPSTQATDNALGAARLALLPRRAWVVNVGRGSTVDEDALFESLRSGAIGGAALDVTAVEPLPAASPLWEAPNTIITPHAAGGRPLGAGRLVSENLARLLRGEPLRNLVER
jgi:phosphoglycerate dehydrogenase-like enzyme